MDNLNNNIEIIALLASIIGGATLAHERRWWVRPWLRKRDREGNLQCELSDDWAIIELQGDIKSHSDSSLEGQFLGHLHFTNHNVPTLIIGHHLLYGKEVKLEKPFVLLEKRTLEDTSEYSVKSVIKRKLIFKTRPKPIVGQ